MSRSVNKVTLIGTLGRDPEVRALANGAMVVSISLATDESYNDKNTGQKVERTEWHRITAFGKLAEICSQYLKKGGKVYFEGKLRTNEYEKDGIKRYSTEIVANDMVMLDRKPEGQQNQGQPYYPNQQQAQQYQQPIQQQAQYQQPQLQQPQYQQPHIQQPNTQQQVQTQNLQQPQQQANYQPAQQQHQNNFDSANFDDDVPF